MRECTNIREKLSAFLDNELPPLECSLMEKHLQTCPACAEEANSLRKINELLDSVPAESPAPAFTARAVHHALAWKRRAYVKEQLYRPFIAYVFSAFALLLHAGGKHGKGDYPTYGYLRNFDDFPPESFSSMYVALIRGEH